IPSIVCVWPPLVSSASGSSSPPPCWPNRASICWSGFATETRPRQRPLILTPLAGRGDVELLAVLRDRSAGEVVAEFFHLIDERIVAERVVLVFLVDDLLQLDADDRPRDVVLAVLGLGAAAKKAFEREQAARRLNPFVVDRSRHGRHMDAHRIGDLLHLQRNNELRPFVEKRGLPFDDRLSNSLQRVVALLDRFNQPLR